MKLPTKVRYAVRALVELAERSDSTPVPVKIIAEAQEISAKYVKQLMNRLQKAGIVVGHPGIHGGYTLARAAEDINLLDIYRALGVSVVLVPCLRADTACDREERCSARLVWKRLSEGLEGTLGGTSIGELAVCERSLRRRG
jgi:Rrf2 family iron-sulfur cluster assembly transcriptional regulator